MTAAQVKLDLFWLFLQSTFPSISFFFFCHQSIHLNPDQRMSTLSDQNKSNGESMQVYERQPCQRKQTMKSDIFIITLCLHYV